MDERIGLFEALYTCRAIRRFRPDPIPDSVLSKVIESATRAPNGSNRQRWRFVVIRDPGPRGQVGEVYRRAMNNLVPAEDAAKDMEILGRRLFQASWYLAEHIGTEPPGSNPGLPARFIPAHAPGGCVAGGSQSRGVCVSRGPEPLVGGPRLRAEWLPDQRPT